MEEVNSKEYFQTNFEIERLSLDEANKKLIKNFTAPQIGKKLEEYLKEKAWDDDLEGETKVYLIKDNTGFLVAFFSIKCGLLYDTRNYKKLSGDEFELTSLIYDLYEKELDDIPKTIEEYCECFDGIKEERKEELIKIAQQKYEDYKEVNESSTHNFKKVNSTYSAIEITHFCKNENYTYNIGLYHGVSFGGGLFWEQILPVIQGVIDVIGCRYLYLFAADNSDYEKVKSLIRYYQDDLKFEELQDLMVMKPDYDTKCTSMVQEVMDLERNRNSFWARYA